MGTPASTQSRHIKNARYSNDVPTLTVHFINYITITDYIPSVSLHQTLGPLSPIHQWTFAYRMNNIVNHMLY